MKVTLAICLVCGRYDEIGLRDALSSGWVFVRCPECQRGIPFDIIAGHMLKRTSEALVEGFCPDHWFRDSGICSYCRMKRIGAGKDAESQSLGERNVSSYGGAGNAIA